MEQEKERKKGSGGARVGAGRKRLNNVMLQTSINADFLARLRERASQAHMTVGAWIEKNVVI